MDTARGAYDMGAETVTCIDVQKPAAFDEEIEYIESRGGKLVWPFMTTKITDEGIYDDKGRFIPGDMIIYHKMIALKNSVIGLYQIKTILF